MPIKMFPHLPSGILHCRRDFGIEVDAAAPLMPKISPRHGAYDKSAEFKIVIVNA